MAVSQRPAKSAGSTKSSAAETRHSDGPAAAAIEVRGAGKHYDHTWVLRGLDFSVQRGSIFGLFGPSGSGKTTGIRMLLGLVAADEGEIHVLGRPPRRFTGHTRAQIGYMPQLFVFYPELTVQQNLHLAASAYGLGWWQRRRPMREVLEFVELWEERGKRAEDLSGGMKRRLELAAALVHDPQLIVMDEPTAGVDPILRAKFWDHFHQLRERGRTLFITSQYVTEAEYCDQVGILSGGGLIAGGPPEEIRRQAMGGEVVEVVTDGLDREAAQSLAALAGVRRAERVSYEQLRLVVDEAGALIPRITARLAEMGVEAQRVEPYRPNFDEVFVRVVEQSELERAE